MDREQLRSELRDALEERADRLRSRSRSETWKGPQWADIRAELRDRAKELEGLGARVAKMDDSSLRWLATALRGE